MRYDPAGTTCAKGPQPGATALMKWCVGAYPDATNLGIFNCRPIRGGGSLSLHAEGRALDVGFPQPNSVTANPHGDELASRLHRHADPLGVQAIIWNRRIWSALRYREGWRSYTGSAGPHLDHVHVELCWDAARSLTGPVIEAVLNPKHASQQEDDMTPEQERKLNEIHAALFLDSEPAPGLIRATRETYWRVFGLEPGKGLVASLLGKIGQKLGV